MLCNPYIVIAIQTYVRKQHWSQLIYDPLNMFLTLLCCILLSIFLEHLKNKYAKFKIHKQAVRWKEMEIERETNENERKEDKNLN